MVAQVGKYSAMFLQRSRASEAANRKQTTAAFLYLWLLITYVDNLNYSYFFKQMYLYIEYKMYKYAFEKHSSLTIVIAPPWSCGKRKIREKKVCIAFPKLGSGFVGGLFNDRPMQGSMPWLCHNLSWQIQREQNAAGCSPNLGERSGT